MDVLWIFYGYFMDICICLGHLNAFDAGNAWGKRSPWDFDDTFHDPMVTRRWETSPQEALLCYLEAGSTGGQPWRGAVRMGLMGSLEL